jgi:hypothetical protein
VGSVLSRGALIVLALLAGGWLAVGLKVVDLEEEGNAAFERARQGSLSRADLAEARHALQSADGLAVDPTHRLIEGRLLVAAGEREQAGRLALLVLAEEPENVDAWYLAYLSAGNPEGRALTRRRVDQLNPLLGDQLE